jgi:hypothetical protein
MKLILAALLAALPACAHADGLTGQDAVYDLTLAKVRSHDLTGATGRMDYRVVDGCTGWGTTQHMTLIVRNIDSSLTKTVSDYVTWESKDGKTLTFRLTESDNDGKTQIDDAGTATHTGPDNAGIITYTTPANTVIKMPPGTLFPMEHTEALLAAGTAGTKFIAPTLFDGTTADGPQATFVAELGHQGPEHNAFPALSAEPSSNVDIAFFQRKNSDQNPDFRTQMRYFDDGVATNLMLDFGDFIMSGKLVSLTIPPSTCAPVK